VDTGGGGGGGGGAPGPGGGGNGAGGVSSIWINPSDPRELGARRHPFNDPRLGGHVADLVFGGLPALVDGRTVTVPTLSLQATPKHLADLRKLSVASSEAFWNSKSERRRLRIRMPGWNGSILAPVYSTGGGSGRTSGGSNSGGGTRP